MNRRHTHLFATAAVTLATAFAAGTALAMAESNDSLNAQTSAGSETYSQSTVAPDEAVDSGAPASDTTEGMGPSDESNDQDMSSSDDSDASSDMSVPDDSSASEGDIVTTPQPLVLPDEPRFTPETGDAQYGSKIAPYTYGPSANRFNDATGQ